MYLNNVELVVSGNGMRSSSLVAESIEKSVLIEQLKAEKLKCISLLPGETLSLCYCVDGKSVQIPLADWQSAVEAERYYYKQSELVVIASVEDDTDYITHYKDVNNSWDGMLTQEVWISRRRNPGAIGEID